MAEREPSRLARLWRASRDGQAHLRDLPPSLAFAVLGQARATDALSPETESRLVEDLLTYWALRRALTVTGVPAAPDRPGAARPPSAPLPTASMNR